MHSPTYDKVARICQQLGAIDEITDESVSQVFENRKLCLEFTVIATKKPGDVLYEVNIWQKKPWCEEKHVYRRVWDKDTGKEVIGRDANRVDMCFIEKGHTKWYEGSSYYADAYWPKDLDDIYRRVKTICNNPPTKLLAELETYGADEEAVAELQEITHADQ
jgi:hypothetical protein